MFILKKEPQPGVYGAIRALFLVKLYEDVFCFICILKVSLTQLLTAQSLSFTCSCVIEVAKIC